ncbi:MAG: hypothetical protein GY774_32080 [Planctomycetes bacterium]|nr:hypothetical protein [Planctomycetota bacterium]
MLRFAKKQVYKKGIIVFLCLLVVGNLAHGKVLCFGVDGHIELESAFHDDCSEPGHSSVSGQVVLSSKADSEICEHCGPCIDVPISKDLVKISNTPQKLNPIFLIQTTNLHTDIDKLNSSVYTFTKDTIFDTSYFDPLQTVILLV